MADRRPTRRVPRRPAPPTPSRSSAPLDPAAWLGRSAFDAAPDALVVANEAGSIVDLNPSAERLFGYVRAELLGQPVEMLMPERFRRAHVGHRAGFAAEPRMRMMGEALALSGLRKDGEEFRAEIALSPIDTPKGRLVITAIRDVTERAQMAQELRRHRDNLEELVQARTAELTRAGAALEQEVAQRKDAEAGLERERRFLSVVLDTAGALIVVLDRTGRIVLFNRACETTTGYAAAEMRGRPVWDLLVPTESEAVRTVFRTLVAGQFPNTHENHWLTRTGEPRLIAWTNTVLLGPDGAVEHVIGTGLDLTERKRAEQQLRKQAALLARERQEILTLNLSLEAKERFIRDVVESMRDGIAILDFEQRIVGGNQALAVHTGIPLEKVHGQRFFAAFPAFRRGDLERSLHALYDGSQDAFVIERFECVAPRTGPIMLNVKGSVVRGSGGHQEGVVLALENITERVRLEQSIQESEKLAMIGTLSAGVAHEINNPIGIMVSRIELMLTEAEESGLPPSIQADLRVLRRNAQRVSRITHGLLSFARRTPGTKASTDLNAVVEDVLTLFEDQTVKAGIAVERDLTPDLPRVEADANQLQQVLLNLLKNAREALGQSGQIRVETGVVADRPDRPGWVRLAVVDSGPGVAPDAKAQLFVPFFTTKADGTGLGLAISYRIVQDHGGVIEVSGAPGQGTVFAVLLPPLAADA